MIRIHNMTISKCFQTYFIIWHYRDLSKNAMFGWVFSFFLRNEFWMIKNKQFNENKLFVGYRMLTIICVLAWHVSMICIILWGHEKRHKIELRDMKYLIALSHFLTLILQKYLRSVTIHYTIEQLYTFLNFPIYLYTG